MTTVLTAGMLAACRQGKNTETTSAGASDVKTEADSVPEVEPEKDAVMFGLGAVDPDGSNFHRGTLAVAEEVNKATDGRITIQASVGVQLGSEGDMCEGAQAGIINMFMAPDTVLAFFIPEMVVLDQPLLSGTAGETRRVIDGTVRTLVAGKTERQEVHTMGQVDVGSRNILSTCPVTSLEDMKNPKICIVENDLHIAVFSVVGAIVTPMAFGGVFTGLQQGAIGTAKNAIANLIAGHYYGITKNVAWTNHVFGYVDIFTSDKAWNQVPDDLEGDLMEGVKVGTQKQRDYLVEANEAIIKELTRLGVESHEIPVDDIRKLVESAMGQLTGQMDPVQVRAIETEKQEG